MSEADVELYSKTLRRQVAEGEDLAETPCVREGELERIRKIHGRPCPRIELRPENYLAAEVVWSSIAEHTRGLAPGLLDAGLAGAPLEEREDVRRRVLEALHSPAVMALVSPAPDPEGAARG